MIRFRFHVMLLAASLACGCGESPGQKNSPSKSPEVAKCYPALKLEIDPLTPAINWSRWFTKARVRLFVRSSADQRFQLVLPQANGSTVFFVNNLPCSKPGDEFVVEVWDDTTSTPQEQEKLAKVIAAGSRILLRTLGNRTHAVSAQVADAPEIDVVAEGLASWKAADWKYLGRATVIVGNNGLPDLRHVNPTALVAANNPREIIGTVRLHSEPSK